MNADIIRMAREAGATTVDADDPQCWIGSLAFTRQELARFATLVRADEREACAKRLEAIGCDHCAANIRAIERAHGISP